MFGFLKRLPLFRVLLREKPDPDEIVDEKWDADFSKPSQVRFHIKSESSFDANLRKKSLVLSLKKSSSIAWIGNPQYRYRDMIIESRIHLDPMGGYAAAGLIFRMVDQNTYYSVLVSSRAYFRLDVLRNGMPFALVGWTEVPAENPDDKESFFLKIIAYSNKIVLAINGAWAADVSESSISEGRLAFTAASYEKGDGDSRPSGPYCAEARLESFSVDSRILEVEAAFRELTAAGESAAASRLRLAETFAAMGRWAPALGQLRKAWESPGHERSQKELLLGARCALGLLSLDESASYIAACLEGDSQSDEWREASIEKAKLLYLGEKNDELLVYTESLLETFPGEATLWALRGQAFWDKALHEDAAAAYDRAFELDELNGITAKNAGNTYELLGNKDEALKRYLQAGRAFLNADNYDDLGSLIPKLLDMGKDNWEARSLAGKWAFGIEDWTMAEKEFEEAERLRKKLRPKAAEDPAMVFLRGLLLARIGKREDALPFLERAAELEPDYPAFRFKLAENRYLLNNDPEDPAVKEHIEAALRLNGSDGWVCNFAAQLALARGDLESADRYLEQAARTLGDIPAIRINRAVELYLKGAREEALELLTVPSSDDPEGAMANCAGNLLVRAGDFDAADEYYRKALSAGPENTEYLCNRASCLIELGLYGEADDVLSRAHSIEASSTVLELIAYVAAKKGEYLRSETACKEALSLDPGNTAVLNTLGWMYTSSGRWDEAREVLEKMDALELNGQEAETREDLRTRILDGTTRSISCASCGRNWRVERDTAPVPALRLYSQPPDDLPAGTCPGCGKTYCIGCAKKHIDDAGRFLCSSCKKTLKLSDEGLKKILYDWAQEKNMPEKKKRGRPPKKKE